MILIRFRQIRILSRQSTRLTRAGARRFARAIDAAHIEGAKKWAPVGALSTTTGKADQAGLASSPLSLLAGASRAFRRPPRFAGAGFQG